MRWNLAAAPREMREHRGGRSEQARSRQAVRNACVLLQALRSKPRCAALRTLFRCSNPAATTAAQSKRALGARRSEHAHTDVCVAQRRANLQEVLARLRRVVDVQPAGSSAVRRARGAVRKRSSAWPQLTRGTHSTVNVPMLVSTVTVGASIAGERAG